jgi:hypothetical protein
MAADGRRGGRRRRGVLHFLPEHLEALERGEAMEALVFVVFASVRSSRQEPVAEEEEVGSSHGEIGSDQIRSARALILLLRGNFLREEDDQFRPFFCFALRNSNF